MVVRGSMSNRSNKKLKKLRGADVERGRVEGGLDKGEKGPRKSGWFGFRTGRTERYGKN